MEINAFCLITINDGKLVLAVETEEQLRDILRRSSPAGMRVEKCKVIIDEEKR